MGKGGVNAASLAAVRGSVGVYNSLQTAVDKWRQDNLAWADAKVKSNASTYSSAKMIGIVLLGDHGSARARDRVPRVPFDQECCGRDPGPVGLAA